MSNGVTCGNNCHNIYEDDGDGVLSFVPGDWEQWILCKSCHDSAGTKAMHLVKGTIVNCGSCHDPHGSSEITSDASDHGGGVADNLSIIRSNTSKYCDGVIMEGETQKYDALFQEKPAHFAFEDPPWNGICQTCHTKTKYHTNDDSALGGHSHKVGFDCTSCHKHEYGFLPAPLACNPPETGDWTITPICCALSDTYQAPADVIVKPGANLIITDSGELIIDFYNHKLLVERYGGVLIESGGKISQSQ